MSKFIELTSKDNNGNFYTIHVNVDNILYMINDEETPCTRIVLYGNTHKGVRESISEIKKKISESKSLD